MRIFPLRNNLRDEKSVDGIAHVANNDRGAKRDLLQVGCDRKTHGGESQNRDSSLANTALEKRCEDSG